VYSAKQTSSAITIRREEGKSRRGSVKENGRALTCRRCDRAGPCCNCRFHRRSRRSEMKLLRRGSCGPTGPGTRSPSISRSRRARIPLAWSRNTSPPPEVSWAVSRLFFPRRKNTHEAGCVLRGVRESYVSPRWIVNSFFATAKHDVCHGTHKSYVFLLINLELQRLIYIKTAVLIRSRSTNREPPFRGVWIIFLIYAVILYCLQFTSA